MKKKKGFTLVELLVVIAILAILAAVSVVGYLSFTNKAKNSNDTSLTTQLNNLLKADEAINGKAKNMADVIEIASNNGFSIDKISTSMSDTYFAWDQVENEILYVDNNFEILYSPDDSHSYLNNWWIIANNNDSFEEANDKGVSAYLNYDINNKITLTKASGLDVGNNKNIEFELSDTDAAESYNFYGDYKTFKVNTPKSDINFYGNSLTADIAAVKMGTFNLFGSINKEITISQGKLTIKNGSDVSIISIIDSRGDIEIDVENTQKDTLIDVRENTHNIKITVRDEVENKVYLNNINGSNIQTEGSIIKDKTIVNNVDDLKSALKETGGLVELNVDILNFKTSDIITIPSNKNIWLDLNNHKISCDQNFQGRPIINKGTLTISGNGAIENNLSETGGYGAINNEGTLIINDGTFDGTRHSSGSVIRNTDSSSKLIINGGTFKNATCIIYNEGKTIINEGSFIGDTCSQCNNLVLSYTFRNVNVKSEMIINGGYIEGVQGAISASYGKLVINDCYAKTVICKYNNNHTATFYALYAAGEEGKVETVINGGVFETEGHTTAVVIGNDNTNGDGGINAPSMSKIFGGKFIAPDGVPSLKIAEKTGRSMIYGGIYSNDISIEYGQYIAEGYQIKKTNLMFEIIKI